MGEDGKNVGLQESIRGSNSIIDPNKVRRAPMQKESANVGSRKYFKAVYRMLQFNMHMMVDTVYHALMAICASENSKRSRLCFCGSRNHRQYMQALSLTWFLYFLAYL